MNRINLAGLQDGSAERSPRSSAPITAQATIDVPPQREAKQLSATIWIVIAWLIGTMVCELNVIGAEPELPQPTDVGVIDHEPFPDKWTSRETEFAITHSGILEFDRMQRDSGLRQEINAILMKESDPEPTQAAGSVAPKVAQTSTATTKSTTNVSVPPTSATQKPQGTQPGTPSERFGEPQQKIAKASKRKLESDAAAGDHSDVTLAFEKTAEGDSAKNSGVRSETERAWKEFTEESIPGLINLVVHSFSELMTPVHVRPLSSDEAIVSAADDPSATDGPVSYVEAVREPVEASDATVAAAAPAGDLPGRTTQDDPDRESTSAVLPVVDLPSALTHEASAQPDIQVETETQLETEAQLETALAGTTIVRSRPQLLSVPENSVMMPPAENRVANIDLGDPRDAADDAVAHLAAKWPFERSQPTSRQSGVSLNVDDTDVRTVFEMLARGYQMNILVAPEVDGVVTANVEGLSPEQTLQGIVKMCGLNMQQDEGMIYIYPSDKIPSDARQLKVFPLDFARAASLEPTIQGLLSPVGNAYPSTVDTEDNMQTQESIVVVDIPSVITQVEQYILQADQAPRQVMIEARVLEVELSDDMLHGVNFGAMLSGDVNFGAINIAEPETTPNPIFFTRIHGSRITSLIDLIETTTDSKTLASPRVQVINGQNARIQVGQQLGFTVATVTQTSTIQDVQFLETGVVLSVTPTISRDNRILMQVKPEVSDGEINPDTLLPEEETREVETSVLLNNHEGVIIGGLIQEKDRTVIKKLPWLGDVKHIGKLFQRREALRSRSEIIVALVPHIVEPGVQDDRSIIEYERTETPLLEGVLQRACRPWEPRLPDRAGSDKHMDVNRLNSKLP